MRVLMVTDFYWPMVGGVEQHVRSLSKALVERGHEVSVATLAADGTGPDRELDGQVRIYRIPSLRSRLRPSQVGRPWAPPFLDPLAALALRRVARLEQPDVVHGHDWLARSAWAACGKRPLVLSLHYYTAACAKKTLVLQGTRCPGPRPARCTRCAAAHYGWLRGPVVAAANAASSRLELSRARAVIGVSAATLAGNRVSGHRFAVVVPNPLPPGALDAEPVSHREIPGLPTGPFIIYVGDRRTEKGLSTLVSAHRLLATAPPLVVLGKPLGEVQLSEDQVPGLIQLGPRSNEDVMVALGRATMVVVPSSWEEPFGIVLLEAMAAGTPIVASHVGGIAEVVQDDLTALLVPPDDPVALARAIQRLLDDPALRRRLISAAHIAAHRFESKKIAAAVEAEYVRAVHRAQETGRQR